MIDDQRFISKLNRISRGLGAPLPVLKRQEDPTGDFLSSWARFLETCVKEGIPLSDPRWQRVGLSDDPAYSRFTLEADEGSEKDADFRVGLKLLMGILEDPEDDS